jgi:DNA-binding NtrC family response regulator
MARPETRRLLIVEDEKTLSYFLAQSFLREPDDYEVVAVGSSEEALEALAERERADGAGRFEVIIADVVLPQRSGLDLLECVRAADSEARVIVITAYGGERLHERARALGAFDYVEKPFEFERLREAVLRAFDAAGLERREQPARGANRL